MSFNKCPHCGESPSLVEHAAPHHAIGIEEFIPKEAPLERFVCENGHEWITWEDPEHRAQD